MPLIECNSENVTANYFPPPLGNGDLSTMLDMEGIQRQKLFINEYYPVIWRAGRRYSDIVRRPMIPFGYIGHGFVNEPEKWTQRLDTQRACIESECHYADGAQLRSEAFIHLDKSVFALRKSFRDSYTFSYTLAQPGAGSEVPARMKFIASKNACGVDISYEIEGLESQRGIISLLCDRPVKVGIKNNCFCLTAEESPASFFLIFADCMDAVDFYSYSTVLKDSIRKEGFEGLFKSHCESWSKYWQESYIDLPGRQENDVYAVSQYHLRISSTRWSIPAGGISNHWNGTYYAFDEFFAFMGLASSGHLDISKRIPEFRHKILKKARLRSFQHWGEENSVDYGARYHFMTDENGDECTPPGYWLEHISQMANVALCSWEQYRFSGDHEFLRDKAYPVISGAAEFYRTQMLYEMGDGRLIVGKCTDLERLGPARENAFMTTCGVIATFEAAAEASLILQCNSEKAALWNSLAGRLRMSLPQENNRYVPHPGCTKKSIAVFAGTFPYPVLESDDPLQLAAIDDFIKNENEYGNMYPVGKSVCVWYAAWKGIVFARMGRSADSDVCIRQIASESNCFSEIFEISDPPMCPWFCTGEGTFIQMLNESLLQSSDSEIRIMKYPAQDYSFRLAARGGIMVELKVVNSLISVLKLSLRNAYRGNLILPDGRSIDIASSVPVEIIVI